MDAELVKALDAMCDDLGVRRLDDVLSAPEPHVYEPPICPECADDPRICACEAGAC